MVNGKIYSAEGLILLFVTLFAKNGTPAWYIRYRMSDFIEPNLKGHSVTSIIAGVEITVRPIYVTLKRYDT